MFFVLGYNQKYRGMFLWDTEHLTAVMMYTQFWQFSNNNILSRCGGYF